MRLRALALTAATMCVAAAGATVAAATTTGPSGPTGPTVGTGSSGPTGATSKPKVVACPAGVASASIGAVQWIWSAYGKPSSSGSPVSYSQTIGKGTWTSGQAKGTICSQNQGGGQPKRSIVLSVSGASTLTAGAKQLGLSGVSLRFPVTVSRSGDVAVCPVGATGTVSLFASYYSVHKDKATMVFTGTCSAWNETFTGRVLHVEISHNGAEIR